MAQSMSEYFLS